jgi:hypothetical protein
MRCAPLITAFLAGGRQFHHKPTTDGIPPWMDNYQSPNADGPQLPAAPACCRTADRIPHFYAAERLYAKLPLIGCVVRSLQRHGRA